MSPEEIISYSLIIIVAWYSIAVFVLLWFRAKMVERSRTLRREFPLPLEEARRRCDGLSDLAPEWMEPALALKLDHVRYRASEHGARILLERVAAEDPIHGEERSAVEVEPQGGDVDLTGLKELLDGALNGEAQG